MSDAADAIVLETERLILRRLTAADAPFILELLNTPAFLAMIGDRGVRTIADAVAYIDRIIDGHARHGFALDLVVLRASGEPLGICGLIRREALDDVDLGFALDPRHWGRGYAREAAAAARDQAFTTHALPRILAITLPSNAASIAVLEAIGMARERLIRLADDDEELWLYAIEAPA